MKKQQEPVLVCLSSPSNCSAGRVLGAMFGAMFIGLFFTALSVVVLCAMIYYTFSWLYHLVF